MIQTCINTEKLLDYPIQRDFTKEIFGIHKQLSQPVNYVGVFNLQLVNK